MRKIYLSIFSLTLVASAIAQRVQNKTEFPVFPSKLEGISYSNDSNSPRGTERGAFDTLYSTTFKDSLPAGWISIDNAGTCGWKWTNKKPQGQYSTTATKLASTSSADGYMILDGDSCNPGQPPSQNIMDAFIQSPAFDLTGIPGVNVIFQHQFRYCCSTTNAKFELQVSTDSTNWTIYDIKRGVTANTATTNPFFETVNISSVAANQPKVWIRFYETGASHYFWMIDDVALTETPPNEMVLNEEFVDFYYTDGGFYTQTPLSQADSITFRAAVLNYGSSPQTNVTLNVDINNGTSSIYNQTSAAIASLPSLAEDTFSIATPFIPISVGSYSTTFTIDQTETDDIPANNTKSVSFSISDTVFARDNGNSVTAGSVGPGNYVGGDVDLSKIATVFEFINAAEINSMSAFVHSSSDVGASFKGILFEVVDWSTYDFAQIMETELYQIAATTAKNKWVTLPFINKDGFVDMVPEEGKDYIVAIETYGSPLEVNLARDLTTNQPDGTSFVFIGSGTTWGWISSQPFIRLNIAPLNDNIKEGVNANKLTIFPNPTSGNSNLTYEIASSSNVTLKVYDVTGKEVMNLNEGTKNAGKNSMIVNTSALNSGVYYYTLSVDDNRITKKLVVVR